MSDIKTLLLVEDDIVDVMTVKRALKELNVTTPVVVMKNGEEALNYLREGSNPLPGIILLDLNMPKMNGIEFLKHVKTDDRLKRIPVVVLTTSRAEIDKVHSYDLGVAGYMIKPVDYPQFVAVMRTISVYWTTSELPG